MEKRNIVTCVILTFITFGIYGVIWFIGLTDDVAKLNDDPNFSGGKALLFSIITFGIYAVYWYYKMGKEIYNAKISRNMSTTDQSVLYLLIRLLGFGLISYCLMQNELNEIVDNDYLY